MIILMVYTYAQVRVRVRASRCVCERVCMFFICIATYIGNCSYLLALPIKYIMPLCSSYFSIGFLLWLHVEYLGVLFHDDYFLQA